MWAVAERLGQMVVLETTETALEQFALESIEGVPGVELVSQDVAVPAAGHMGCLGPTAGEGVCSVSLSAARW